MRIPSTLLIAICTIITSIGNVFAAQADPILAHAMPIVRTADGDTVPCFSIKIQPVILNGQTGPYCPTYGNLTLAAVDSATGNRIPGLTYSWSGLSVNTLSDSALTWLIIVPEWCDTVYYPTVTVSDGHGCVKTVTDTVEVRSSGPQFIGNLPDIDVSPQSGGGYMIPDFKSLISNTIVTSICYPFYAIKYSDAYGTVERADWYSQEPAAGAVFTEDSVAVVITITDPCGVSNSTTVNVLRSDGNPDTSVVIDGISCPAAPMVTDHEGNIYATVQIGNQCWMRDNLRTTTSPSTGTYLIPAANVGDTYTGKQARWYNNDSATYAPMNYGLLYNWNAAVDTFNTEFGETSVNSTSSNAVSVSFTGHRRGICPAGWHLPSDTEWNTMEATVSGSDWWWTIYETFSGGRGSHAGKLAGGDDWTTSSTSGAPGDYSNAERNVSGFSALPAGECYGTFIGSAGVIAIFWSSSQLESDSSNAWSRFLLYYNEPVIRSNKYKYYGCSVRCLRDEVNTSSLPTVTTGPVTSVTSTSATCGGEVTSDGGATVTARGVCWSTSPNPTVADSHTSDGNGMGSFNSYISGLIPNTTYYVRAYATNQYGTVYGEELSFTTPCPVISINGPSYIHLFGEITLMASGGDNYVWNTGDSSSTITITVTPNGTVTYSVTGTDDYGCIGSTSKVVTTYPSINPTEAGTGLTDIEVDCNNPSVTLCANVIAKTTTDYTVESIPFNPPFDFTEGTRRGLDFDGIEDRWGSSTNLPFCFSYYGWNYTHIVPGSNSVASFGYHSGECNWRFSDSIPSSNLFTNTIFACYRDIDTRYFGTNGGVFDSVYGEWPNRCYKLSFNNIGLFNDNAHSPTFSSMIVLYEGTNIIEIYLRDAPTNTSWNNGNGVLGLQNFTGTKGITPPGRNTGPWTAHEEAWRFIPVADSNYTVTWYLGTDTTLATGIIVGTGDTITVFPQESTDYTAWLQYTDDCGRTFTIAQTCHVTVNREGPNVTVNASQNELCEGDNTTLTATGADTYLWSTGDEGSSITVYPTTTTTYYVTGYSGAECSSIDSITVTVWESVDSVITVTACDSYTWNDTIYYISGEYVQHFQTIHGCDSIVTMNLTINQPDWGVWDEVACDSFTWIDGVTYYESTSTPTVILTNAAGCDSVVTLNLMIIHYTYGDTTAVACGSFDWYEYTGITQSGEYTHIFEGGSVYGCDSTVTLHITVIPIPEVTITGTTTIFPEDSTMLTAIGADNYIWSTGDHSATITVNSIATTTYSVTGRDSYGCVGSASTVVSVHATPSINPAEVGTGLNDIELDCNELSVTLCANVVSTAEDYIVENIPYDPPYNFTDGINITQYLSDDIWSFITDLPFTFRYYGYLYNQIVPGSNSVATFNTNKARQFCDYLIQNSIPSMHLFANTIFACYRDLNLNYLGTEGGAYEGVFGEAPYRRYKLSFNNVGLFGNYTSSNAIFSSMIVLYEGSNIIDIYLRDAPNNSSTNNGNGVLGLQNSTGTKGITPPGRNTGPWTAHEEAWRFIPVADSNYTVTWYLGTDTTLATGIIVGTGDTITVFPQESTDYTARLQHTDDCGRTFTIAQTCHVTVNREGPNVTVNASQNELCEGDNTTLTATGADTYLWSTGDEGSSITVYPTTTTTYYVTGYSGAECSSIDSITVTVWESVDSVITVTACDSYTWNDTIYYISGEYVQHFQTVHGCDSIVTMNLTINQPDWGVWDEVACDSFTWIDGVTYYESTSTPTVILTNAAGCDSVVTLNLTIIHSTSSDTSAVACGSFTWKGETHSASGDYTFYEINSAGCDSVVTLHLTINSTPEVSIIGDSIICPNGAIMLTATGADNYLWSNGSTNSFIPVNQFGIYRVTGTSATGCANTDSITVLVAQPPAITISGITDLCAGDTSIITVHGGTSYLWNNGSTDSVMTVSDAGAWQVIGYDENGCNSMTSVNVNVWQPTVSEFSVFCPDSCYIWNYQTYCESGDYTQTLQTTYGCDSIVTLHLTITVGINDHDGFDFKVYPNPTSNIVNVECIMKNEDWGEMELHLCDAYGRLLDVVRANNYSPLQIARIDLSQYANGIYFLKAVADGKTIAVRKVVKQ